MMAHFCWIQRDKLLVELRLSILPISRNQGSTSSVKIVVSLSGLARASNKHNRVSSGILYCSKKSKRTSKASQSFFAPPHTKQNQGDEMFLSHTFLFLRTEEFFKIPPYWFLSLIHYTKSQDCIPSHKFHSFQLWWMFLMFANAHLKWTKEWGFIWRRVFGHEIHNQLPDGRVNRYCLWQKCLKKWQVIMISNFILKIFCAIQQHLAHQSTSYPQALLD